MGNRHTLRRPRRPRGLDHIRRLPSPHRNRRQRRRIGQRPIQDDQPRHVILARVIQTRTSNQHPRPAVRQQQRPPRRRITRIHRQIRRPRPPPPHNAGNHLPAPAQPQPPHPPPPPPPA